MPPPEKFKLTPPLEVLAFAFLLSGAASLMDQVVWLRYLSLIFGNTTWAAATLLAVFMGGLGLGALLFGRWADRIVRPLALYALMEIAIGVIALASPWFLSWIDSAYILVYRGWGNMPWLFAGGRTLLVALFLLPPTILMGGTLPLVLRATTRARERVGASSGFFYGINTTGAVLGTAFAGFLSIWQLGLYRTLVIAAFFNLVAALASLLVARHFRTDAATARSTAAGTSRQWLLTIFFVMGATSLAYEVFWTRILLFHLGSSVYAYSLMLLAVLVGIGLGSLLAIPWADRVGSPLRALVWVELAIALWIPVQVLLFQQLDLLLLTATELIQPTGFGRYTLGQLLAILPLLGPPTLLMGMSFPLAVRAMNRDPERLFGLSTPPAIELAAKLAEMYPGPVNHFQFTSGGAESNETAMKIARYYWALKGQPEKITILSRFIGYHGIAMGTLSATGIPAFWQNFGPRPEGFVHLMAPYPYRNADDPEDLEAFVDKLVTELEETIEQIGADNIAAMIGEPIQGAGGVIIPPERYWDRICEVLTANDILLIADEVITGFGRTGEMFGSQTYDFQPDIVSVAKGISSGYIPLGAVGVTDEIFETMLEPDAMFMHGFTYSGHPVACAVAIANIGIIEREDLASNAKIQGEYLLGKLEELSPHQNVGEVRGKGLMMMVEVVKDKDSKEPFTSVDDAGPRLAQAVRKHGIVPFASEKGIMISPPLTITREEADQIAEAIRRSIVEVFG